MVRTGGPDSERCHFSLFLSRTAIIQRIYIRKWCHHPFPNDLAPLKPKKSFFVFLAQLGPLVRTSPDHYFRLWTNTSILVSFDRFFWVDKKVLLDRGCNSCSFWAMDRSITINKQRNRLVRPSGPSGVKNLKKKRFIWLGRTKIVGKRVLATFSDVKTLNKSNSPTK